MNKFDIDAVLNNVAPVFGYLRNQEGNVLAVNNSLRDFLHSQNIEDPLSLTCAQMHAASGLNEKDVNHILGLDQYAIHHNRPAYNSVHQVYSTLENATVTLMVNRIPYIKNNKVCGLYAFYQVVSPVFSRILKLYKSLRSERHQRRSDIRYLRELYAQVLGKPAPSDFKIQECSREIHHFLSTIIHEMPGSVYWKNRDCVYLGGNREALELAGCQESGIVGKTDFDFAEQFGYPAGVAEAWYEDDQKVMRNKQAERDIVEPAFLRPDGEEIYQLANKVPLLNREQEVIGLLGISVDVTHLRKTEFALREANTQNNILLDLASNAIIGVDDNDEIIFINSSGARKLGYQIEELIGKDIKLIFSSNPAIANNQLVLTALAQRQACQNLEVELCRKSEQFFPGELTINIVDDKDFNLSYVVSFHDITERKNAQQILENEVAKRTQALQQANEQLRQEMQQRHHAEQTLHTTQLKMAHMHRVNTIGEMMYGIAHELNQPLTAITQYTGGCIRRLQATHANADIINAMNQVCKQAERAGSILHRLKNYLRKKDLMCKLEDINQVIEEAITYTELQCKKHEIDIQLVLASDLPQVNIDRIQFSQVIVMMTFFV